MGVGHNEDSLSSVRSTDVMGAELERTRSVAESVQIPPHAAQIAALPARDVLDDDEGRREGFDDVAEDEPQAGALPVEASAETGSADVLTGEAAADDVDSRKRSCCTNIGHAPVNVGPARREDAAAEGVDLHLPDDPVRDACLGERGFKAKLQAADAGEEGADAEGLRNRGLARQGAGRATVGHVVALLSARRWGAR
jgi:hypothetical protein